VRMSVTNDMPDAPKIHKEINTVDVHNTKNLFIPNKNSEGQIGPVMS